MRKSSVAALIILIALIPSAVFAQAKTSLTIQSNQTGARVYLNDKLAGYASPNFSSLVIPGTYLIRVAKDGFSDFTTTAVVGQSPITIIASLLPPKPPAPPSVPPKPPAPQPYPQIQKHQLSIDANVRGAQVWLNGSYAGTTPFYSFLPAGNYSIVVRIDGYEDYSRIVKLTGSYQLRASLNLRSFPVYIDASNAAGASLYRDSNYIGSLPYRGEWNPGVYSIRITAPGYADYVDRISLAAPLTLRINLPALYVDYEISVPTLFAAREGRPLEFKDMDFYLDGQRLGSPYGRTNPGTHRLTVFLRDMRFEADFDLVVGKTAIIEPFLGIKVR